jgi:tetratricopeptide (TPR) repeat protein
MAATISPLMLEACTHHEAGRLDEAFAAYDAVLEAEPGNVLALAHRSLIAHERGDTAAALGGLGRAIALEPRRADLYNNLGHLYRQRGDTAAAARLFCMALALDPAHAPAALNAGITAVELGDPRRGLELFERAVRARPDHFAPAHVCMAHAYRALGEPKEALRAALTALQDSPQNEEARGLADELKIELATMRRGC